MQKGYLVTGGIKKASVWSTPVVCGPLDGTLFTMIAAGQAREYLRDKSMGHAQRSQLPGFAGNFKHVFEVGMPLRYGGFNVKRWIAGILGSNTITTLDTTAKQHTLKMLKDLVGIMWTFAYENDKDAEVFEYTTIKILGITLRGSKGQPLELSVRVAAHSFNQNQGSGTNNTTTIDTINLGTDGVDEVLMQQGKILCNAASGGAYVLPTLGVLNDALVIDGFEVAIDGKFNTDKYNTEYGYNIAEPQHEEVEDNVTLKLNFSEYGVGNRGRQVLIDTLAKNQKKVKLYFESANLAGAISQKYAHNMYFPRVVFADGGAPGVSEKGEPKWDVTGICHFASAAPMGFPVGYTDPITWEIIDKDAVDPLA